MVLRCRASSRPLSDLHPPWHCPQCSHIWSRNKHGSASLTSRPTHSRGNNSWIHHSGYGGWPEEGEHLHPLGSSPGHPWTAAALSLHSGPHPSFHIEPSQNKAQLTYHGVASQHRDGRPASFFPPSPKGSPHLPGWWHTGQAMLHPPSMSPGTCSDFQHRRLTLGPSPEKRMGMADRCWRNEQHDHLHAGASARHWSQIQSDQAWPD
mmetsp:Transcript_146401/g.255732  ORF Transcript_146401/g.255732 Transcript_146401/m.255732 type:complete len:207 (+) Transcript_146401:559-1179(+)